MIGQKQSWLRSHRVGVSLLAVGLILVLGLFVSDHPLTESFLGMQGVEQIEDQNEFMVEVSSPPMAEFSKPSWHLSTHEKNKAKLVVPPNAPNSRRVQVTQAETTDGWHIQLSHKPIQIVGQEWYSLRFRARADEVRNMGTAVIQAHGPWKVLGLYRSVPLMRQWQDFEWEFRSTEDDINAQITFDLGGWNIPVEVADVRLLKLSNRILRWRLHFREGSEARLESISKSPLGTRVAISKSPKNKPDHIQLVQLGLKLQANERYRLRFNARADKTREIRLAISQAQYPWEGLGLKQAVSLDSEWQLFDIEFVATSTDEYARLTFDLGGRSISVEIDAVLLQKTSAMVTHSEIPSVPSLDSVSAVREQVGQS